MEMHTNDQLKTSERPFQQRSQATRLCFLLPRVGLVLLACFTIMMTVVQPTYAAQGDGKVYFLGNGTNMQAELDNLALRGLLQSNKKDLLLLNTPLIIHVHAKNEKSSAAADRCKGPVLFQITGVLKTIGLGAVIFTGRQTFTPVGENNKLLDRNLITTWVLNVHRADLTALDPATNTQKPVSVACSQPAVKNGDQGPDSFIFRF